MGLLMAFDHRDVLMGAAGRLISFTLLMDWAIFTAMDVATPPIT